MENAIEQLNQANQEQHTMMQSIQQQQQKHEQNTKSYIDNSMQDLKQELDRSFASALNTHAQSFNSSLAEIKQLFITKRKAQEAPGNDMES